MEPIGIVKTYLLKKMNVAQGEGNFEVTEMRK